MKKICDCLAPIVVFLIFVIPVVGFIVYQSHHSDNNPQKESIGADLIYYGYIPLPDGRTWPVKDVSWVELKRENFSCARDVFCNVSVKYHEDTLDALVILHYRYIPDKEHRKDHQWLISKVTTVRFKEEIK